MDMKEIERLHALQDSQAVMKWYGWGSPVGLSLFFGVLMVATGLMLYLLHLAGMLG
jgi:hypothetical protein